MDGWILDAVSGTATAAWQLFSRCSEQYRAKTRLSGREPHHFDRFNFICDLLLKKVSRDYSCKTDYVFFYQTDEYIELAGRIIIPRPRRSSLWYKVHIFIVSHYVLHRVGIRCVDTRHAVQACCLAKCTRIITSSSPITPLPSYGNATRGWVKREGV